MTSDTLEKGVELKQEIAVQTGRLLDLQELQNYSKSICLNSTHYGKNFYLSEKEGEELITSLDLKTQSNLVQLRKEFEDL